MNIYINLPTIIIITIECTPSYKYLYKLTGGNITITSQIAILVAKCLFTTNLHKTLTIIDNNEYFTGFSNFLQTIMRFSYLETAVNGRRVE